MNRIIHGDSTEELKHLEDNSVDLLVTDPPYGYSFMGKDWDKAVPSVEIWQECLRVLKPGGFAFIMSAPRSDVLSRMIVRIEDAGFRVDFSPIYWSYASGFPKAMNISKAVDKRMGVEFDIKPAEGVGFMNAEGEGGYNVTMNQMVRKGDMSPEAKALDGSYGGFQPKPAVEVVIVAMKPLSEKTYVDQALANGKGITWLMPDCGIPVSADGHAQDAVRDTSVDALLNSLSLLQDAVAPTTLCSTSCISHDHHAFDGGCILGKELHQWLLSFRSHLLASSGASYASDDHAAQGSPVGCLACRRSHDEQSHQVTEDGLSAETSLRGVLADIYRLLQAHSDTPTHLCTDLLSNYDALLSLVHSYTTHYTRNGQKEQTRRFPANLIVEDDILGDYSRFFSLEKWAENLPFLAVPKASKREKNEGLEGFPLTNKARENAALTSAENRSPHSRNSHPTVKPLTLMSYLITLGSREGDTVLDPFVGSGTTALAAKKLNRNYIGIEREEEYVKIAEARLTTVENTLF